MIMQNRKELPRGPNSIEKRYFRDIINGYRFHVRQRNARCKIQNSGVTLVASTISFASSKDKNQIVVDLTYYGRIVDIVELDYYDHFKVIYLSVIVMRLKMKLMALLISILTIDALRMSLLCLISSTPMLLCPRSI